MFNQMLAKAKELGLIEGLLVRKNKVKISHLQFADDTLIFCPANEHIIINYRRLLDC